MKKQIELSTLLKKLDEKLENLPDKRKRSLSRSQMREFETALGQYLIYQTFLSITHPDHKVYLAVGNKIYEKFFEQVAIELILHFKFYY